MVFRLPFAALADLPRPAPFVSALRFCPAVPSSRCCLPRRAPTFSHVTLPSRAPYPSPLCVPPRSAPEMVFLLLLLAGLAVGASGQQCVSSDCATCLTDPRCSYYNNCGVCTSLTGSSCGGEPAINNAALCLAPPSAAEAARPLSSAYWTLTIAFIASGGLVALLYSPLEQLCGQRRKFAGSVQRSFGYSHYLLLLACWCLWFGFSLSLAAPALPWIVAATTSSTAALTAFNAYACTMRGDGTSYCYIFRSMDISSGGFGSVTFTDTQYVEEGFALGVVGYIVGIGLLFRASSWPALLCTACAGLSSREFRPTLLGAPRRASWSRKCWAGRPLPFFRLSSLLQVRCVPQSQPS